MGLSLGFDQLIFALGFTFAYTIQAVTGFAGNLFIMPIGVSTIGLESSVAVLNAMGVFACGLLALTNLQDVNWREFYKITAIMLVCMLVGIWLNTLLPLDFLLKLYALVIVYVGIKNFFITDPQELPSWLLYSVVVLAGLIHGMFVSGGAFLVIYATQRLRDKQEFRITLSLIWTVLNAVYMAIGLHAGSFTPEVISMVLMCIPLAFVATFLGNCIGKRISHTLFKKLVFGLLSIMGVALLISSL